MITIKNRLDFIIKEEEKTHVLSAFKSKKPPERKIKDISSVIEKTTLVQNQIKEQNKKVLPENNIQKINKPLKSLPIKKNKPVVWL